MDSHQADITLQNGRLMVSGQLDFGNVMSVYEKSLALFERCAELNIDFSPLKSSDSSGIALVIEWIKYAKQHHKAIQLINFPQDLKSIVKAARLEKIVK